MMGLNLTGVARDIKFTPAAGAANVCDVALQIIDAYGNNVAESLVFNLWLSDAATGLGVTGESASGTVQAKSAATGKDIGILTAQKALVVQSVATGGYTLEITDTAKTAFYVAATIPGGPNAGRTVVSRVLATADYGA